VDGPIDELFRLERDPSPRDSELRAEFADVFDFELSSAEVDAIDALDTGIRGGPDPANINLESSGREIPEA
jgi:diketogulonate reductase-like aldo/keto reductase